MGLPFRLNPFAKSSYTEQLADALREAIRAGHYRTGEKLPSWDAMAAALGVSRRIPRDAMKMLANEGLVMSRPRIGTVVGNLVERRLWKAPVLFVRYEVDGVSYASNVQLNTFRRRLLDAGYPTMPIEIPRKKRGGFDFPLIDSVRQFRHSLVVNDCAYHPEIRAWCAGIGVPVLDACEAKMPWKGELGNALQALADHCRRNGIKRIMEVTFASPATLRLPPAFARMGIKVEGWMIPPLKDCPRLESIRNAAQQAFAQRLMSEGRGWLPDLLFFVDDYLATGAFVSLALAGVRIPEDVKVVTLANEGNVPVWNGTCAMLLTRPTVWGERLAAAALERLSGKALNRFGTFKPMIEYIPGDTFPD